jgi:nucleoside 2-deoxyribosyltransferase
MRIFVAYRATGEDEHTLLQNLRIISDAIHTAGHEPYCTHLQKEAMPNADKIKTAFGKIDESDALLAFVHSEEKSEGMTLEIGYAYGKKKPIHVFTRASVHLVSFELADTVTEWGSLEELPSLIQDRFAQVQG